MAKKEIVNVITIKTEESQNTIKGLKKEIADLKKNLDNAVIGSDEFEKASKDLAKAQNDLKTALADGKKTTDNVEGSYNHLVSTMAELKKEWKATADEVKRNDLAQQIDAINTELKDMDASIGNFQRNVGDYANSFKEAFDQQQKSTENVRIGLDGLQKTAAGLASGYAAVQGTMALLNIESAEFEKTMIKVQSAMAIAQGIGGMKDLIEGGGTLITVFKNSVTGVKAFIKSLTPVKAAIASTGIGIFVVLLGTLVANWDKVTAKLKELDAFDKLKENVMGVYNVLKTYLLAPFKALGEIISGDFKAGIEELKQAFMFAENFKIGKIAEQEKQAADAILETAKQSALATENYIKDQEAKLGSDWKYTNEGIAAYRKFYNEKLSLYQKDSEDYKNIQRDLWSFERELKEKKSSGNTTSGATSFTPTKQEGVLSQLSGEYDLEVELFAASRERMVTINEEANKQMLEQVKAFGKKETDRIREDAEKQKAIKEMVTQSSLSIASDALGSLSSIIGEETAVGKAAAVAQTTIDTFQSAQAAYKSMAGIPVVGPALGIAAATAAALAGAANVKKILAVKTDGVGNGDVDTSTPSPAVSPRVNLSENMPIQYTRDLLTDSELSNINQEQTVVVLESDITDTQNRVKVKEQNASF